MKKTLFALACVGTVFAANAQVQVLKDAEKAMKSGKDYVAVYEMVLPAMSNPETAKEALTYYIPGKAGFQQYDQMLGLRQFGRLPENGEVIMSTALMGGYDNFMKALPLDTVVDAKGKVKTKYSKEIKNLISGHYNDFTQAGIDFYNAKDYQNAYNAWATFAKISENPEMFGVKAENLQPDSVVANFIMNAGLAAWQMGDNELASKTFKQAAEKGYDNENIWQYGLATAIQANQPDLLLYFANEGNNRYGDTDTQYINSLINFYLQNERYDDAINYLKEAVQKNPQGAQYYALEGIIYDAKDDLDTAKGLYEKAIALDPENGLGNYYLGRSLLLEASKLDDSFDGPNSQYEEFKNAKLVPLYKDAVVYLEKAYEVDPNNRDSALKMLEQLYYVLNDQQGMDSVNQRKLD